MLKLLLIAFIVGLSYAAIPSPPSMAQMAVEYGVMDSKTSPYSPDISGKVDNKIQNDSRRTGCPSNACKKTPAKTLQKRSKGSESLVEKRVDHKGTGPLIIEKRGEYYEKIN